MNNYFYNGLNRYNKCDLLTEASYGINSECPVTFDNVIKMLTRNKIWSILSSSENIVFEFNSLKDATVQEIDKNKNVSPEPFFTLISNNPGSRDTEARKSGLIVHHYEYEKNDGSNKTTLMKIQDHSSSHDKVFKDITNYITSKYKKVNDEYNNYLTAFKSAEKVTGYADKVFKLACFEDCLRHMFKVIKDSNGVDDINTRIQEFRTKDIKQLDEQLLLELNRNQLINKSKHSDSYKDTSKGRNRWERRNRSKIDTHVAQYNKIDMNKLFKNDELVVGIGVRGETSNYTVTIRYLGVIQEISNQIKANKGKFEFKVVLVALQKVFNTGNVFVSCSCLHPETKIKLLDGTFPTVEELKTRFDSGEKLYAYSVDSNGDFKPGIIENVWVTKTTTDFIKVTLDNDKEIITTPEHLYMLRDGTYMQASQLKENDSLMPLYLNHKVKKVEHLTLSETPVYDLSIKDFSNFLVDGGVILHNCPDWKYRQSYNATRGGYNSGPAETRASNITNPGDSKGAGCKHVNLVIGNVDWILKIASVINNYVNYIKDHMQRQYADIIFPKLYGVPYTKAVQLNLFDTGDDLNSGEEEIKLSNRYGRERTKFRSDVQVNNAKGNWDEKGNRIKTEPTLKLGRGQTHLDLDKEISEDENKK